MGILVKGAIALGSIVVVFLIWALAGRHISLVLDRVKTVRIASLPAMPVDYDGSETAGTLQIGGTPMSTYAPDYKPFPMRINFDSQGRDVLSRSGKSFILVPEPGDEISFTLERSLMSWPTPFDLNLMTGQSPSWRRHLYYVLRWKKPSGSKLEMVWRYEQLYYDSWTSGYVTREGSTGLIQVQVSN